MINYKSLSKLFTLCCNIVTVIILFINIGCQTPQNKVSTGEHIISDSTLIQINVDPDGEESYAFDSLIDDISYIKLETNSDCLIGNIHQILCSNEYIFIMDVFVANAVYCFDKHGNFVRRIGKVGQGPGEYSRLCKMCLTSDQKQIVLYDWNRLHYYDLNGKHIKDVSPSFYANDIELINNDFIAGFIEAGMDDDSQRQMLSVYNKDFKLLYREFPSFYNEVFHLNNGMHPLRSFGNDIYLKEPWTHNIYKIEKDRCYEKYRINITNGGYPERPEDMNSDTYIKIVGTKVHMADYVILEDYALFYFSKNGFTWSPFVIYSHKTKKTYKCNGRYYNPLFFAHSPGNTPIVCYDKETFLIPQSASTVMRMKEKIYNSPLINDSKLMQLYDGLTEDSNPVLFLLHIKSI